jgi:hypothetical protein
MEKRTRGRGDPELKKRIQELINHQGGGYNSGDFCGRFLRTPAPSGGIKRLESGKTDAVALSGNKSFPAKKI